MNESEKVTPGMFLTNVIRKALDKIKFYPLFGLIAGIIAVLPLKLIAEKASAGVILFYAVVYVVILERLNNFSFTEDFRQKSNHTAANLLIIAKVAAVYLILLRLALSGETQIMYQMLVAAPCVGWSAIMVEKDLKYLPAAIATAVAVILTFGIFTPENILMPAVDLHALRFNPVTGIFLTGFPLILAAFSCIMKKAVFADTAMLVGYLILADKICYA